MPKWYLFDGRSDDLLKKIKALRDAPGTEGERAAAEAAYRRVKGKDIPVDKPIPSTPKRKRSTVSGPGGFDYESSDAWRQLLKNQAVFRFVSEHAKSRWKQLHSVDVKRNLPLLEISDWPSGTNRTVLTMSRRTMGKSGIEFRSKRLGESKWKHLIEATDRWRDIARRYKAGDESQYVPLIRELRRAGKISADTTMGELEDVFVDLGIHQPTTLSAIQQATHRLNQHLSWIATRIREEAGLDPIDRRFLVTTVSRLRMLRNREIAQTREYLGDEHRSMGNYQHNSRGYIRALRAGQGEHHARILMNSGIPWMRDELNVLADREQVLQDAIMNAHNLYVARRARLRKSEE